MATQTQTALQPSLRVRATDIGEFVRHRSCQRRFKLGYDNQALFKVLPFSGQPFHTIDPVLAQAGARREDEWARMLEDAEFTRLELAAEDGEFGVGWDALHTALEGLSPGQCAFAREVRIVGRIGAFEVLGRIDFVVVTWHDGSPRLTICECKASRRDRTYQRLQAVTYELLVTDLLARCPLTLAGATLGPEHVTSRVVRIDETTNQLPGFDALEPITGVDQLAEDLRRLLAADGTLAGLVEAQLEDVPYQLDGKCDDCFFSLHCLTESARLRRLELIGVDTTTARIFHEHGLTTLDHLADLDLDGSLSEAIRNDPDFATDLEALHIAARTRRTTLPGGAADPDDYEVTALPRRGYGQLPEHEVPPPEYLEMTRAQRAQAGPAPTSRLVRVFLSVSYDYTEDRIGALAAHVTRSDGELYTPFQEDLVTGRWSPQATVRERYRVGYEDEANRQGPIYEYGELDGVDIVELQPVCWSGHYEQDTGAEATLMQRFFRRVVEAIEDVAEPDTEVPLHFYVWMPSEIQRLVEACARVGGGMLRSLRELMGCRDKLEQLIYSSLRDEVDRRYALGWTGRGLGVVASLRWFGQRFHWRRRVYRSEVDLDRVFGRDQFDFRSALPISATGDWLSGREHSPEAWHPFEVRSCFFDSLSMPYLHAYWGELPEPSEVRAPLRRPLRDYRAAGTRRLLESYLGARVQAMRWLEERIQVKNRSIAKPPLAIAELPRFELQTDDAARAAVDFMRFDQHVKLTEALQAFVEPASVRVARGRCLPLRDLERVGDDKDNTYRATLDAERFGLQLEVLEARSSVDSGAFMRLSELTGEPHEGQALGAYLWYGKTCVVKEIDWASGEVELSMVPSSYRANRYYVVPSHDFDPPEYPIFERATLDGSVTDFVGSRVEKRLLPSNGAAMTGAHVLAWFDPVRPQLPAMPPLPADRRATLRAVLEAVRLGGEHPLVARRIDIVLDGLDSRVQLVQGPPGTGKTTLSSVAILVRVLARLAPGQMVFVAAHTHRAVDTLLQGLDAALDPVAVAATEAGLALPPVVLTKVGGAADRDDRDAVGGRVVELLSQPKNEHYDLVKAWTKPSGPEARVMIVGGTTNGLLKFVGELSGKGRWKKLDAGLQTPLLVIDEASMLVFAHFLALASLVEPDGQILLAGDNRQLAPIVAHDWSREDRPPAQLYRMHDSAFDAIASLIEPEAYDRHHQRRRLGASQVRRDGLEITYRLPATIRELIQPLYDRDDITLRAPGAGGEATASEDGFAPGGDALDAIWRVPSSLVLVEHSEASSRQGNGIEATLAFEILERGRALGELGEKSVAVITPHRNQRARLRGALTAFTDEITVIDTVERLQGGESDMILFSATVSDPVAIAEEVEFILHLERSNVAFSRTRRRLIVLCARTLLDHIPTEVAQYDSALLWKVLRGLCGDVVAEGASPVPYRVLVPSLAGVAQPQSALAPPQPPAGTPELVVEPVPPVVESLAPPRGAAPAPSDVVAGDSETAPDATPADVDRVEAIFDLLAGADRVMSRSDVLEQLAESPGDAERDAWRAFRQHPELEARVVCIGRKKGTRYLGRERALELLTAVLTGSEASATPDQLCAAAGLDARVWPEVERELVARGVWPGGDAGFDLDEDDEALLAQVWQEVAEVRGARRAGAVALDEVAPEFFFDHVLLAIAERVEFRARRAVWKDEVVHDVLEMAGLDARTLADAGCRSLERCVRAAFRGQRAGFAPAGQVYCLQQGQGLWALTEAGVERARGIERAGLGRVRVEPPIEHEQALPDPPPRDRYVLAGGSLPCGAVPSAWHIGDTHFAVGSWREALVATGVYLASARPDTWVAVLDAPEFARETGRLVGFAPDEMERPARTVIGYVETALDDDASLELALALADACGVPTDDVRYRLSTESTQSEPEPA